MTTLLHTPAMPFLPLPQDVHFSIAEVHTPFTHSPEPEIGKAPLTSTLSWDQPKTWTDASQMQARRFGGPEEFLTITTGAEAGYRQSDELLTLSKMDFLQRLRLPDALALDMPLVARRAYEEGIFLQACLALEGTELTPRLLRKIRKLERDWDEFLRRHVLAEDPRDRQLAIVELFVDFPEMLTAPEACRRPDKLRDQMERWDTDDLLTLFRLTQMADFVDSALGPLQYQSFTALKDFFTAGRWNCVSITLVTLHLLQRAGVHLQFLEAHGHVALVYTSRDGRQTVLDNGTDICDARQYHMISRRRELEGPPRQKRIRERFLLPPAHGLMGLLANRAQDAAQEQEYENAVRLAQATRKLAPYDDVSLYCEAFARMEAGDYQQAVRCFREWESLGIPDPDAENCFAYCLYLADETATAHNEAARRLLKLLNDPQTPKRIRTKCQYNLAEIYATAVPGLELSQGEFLRALQDSPYKCIRAKLVWALKRNELNQKKV